MHHLGTRGQTGEGEVGDRVPFHVVEPLKHVGPNRGMKSEGRRFALAGSRRDPEHQAGAKEKGQNLPQEVGGGLGPPLDRGLRTDFDEG